MTNQLITYRLPIDYSLISLMSSISYVWPDTAREEPQHMIFVSVNSERDTISASLCNGRHFKRKWKGRLALWKCNELDSIHVLSHPQSLFSISLPNAWYDTGYVLSGLETTAQCIKSGFLLLQKEAKTRKWKALKNILKVNELKTRTFQLLYARENRHYLD